MSSQYKEPELKANINAIHSIYGDVFVVGKLENTGLWIVETSDCELKLSYEIQLSDFYSWGD